MEIDTIERLDLARTFVRPTNEGNINAIPLATAFWRGKAAHGTETGTQ